MYGDLHWKAAWEDYEKTNPVVGWLEELRKAIYPENKSIGFNLRSNPKLGNEGKVVNQITILVGTESFKQQPYKDRTTYLWGTFSVSETYSNCGLLQLALIPSLLDKDAVKFAELLKKMFKERMGYSAMLYTTAHHHDDNIEDSGLVQTLRAMGFVPCGDIWRNNRSGRNIQNWMWVM